MKRYLIIGNGVAGTTAAGEIRKNDPDGTITIVTEEQFPFYSRIKLPYYVAGHEERSGLPIRKEQWYEDRKIDLHTGINIVDIDTAEKKAVDGNGTGWKYDELLIATGSRPFVPPIKGKDLSNVFALRTVDDADRIIAAARTAKTTVAIGGGLLGLEAAYGLIQRGLSVTVVEFFDRLLPRQMDSEGALLLKEMLENQGFAFRLGEKTSQIKGEAEVTGVMLESGEELPADLVLFSAGVRSNLDLPEKIGLETQQGVVVNGAMATSTANIYAAGDVAQFDKTNFCIWPEAQEQGRIAGASMAGNLSETFNTVVPSNRLKVAGIELASAGEIDADGTLESDVEKKDQVYRKIVKKEGKPVGCIMLGNTSGFSQLVKQMGLAE